MNLGHKFKIKLLFTDIEEVYVSDLSSLLYNLESACDLAMILYLEDYKEYRVPTDYYGRFRKIKKEHKLCLSKITKESPLEVVLVFSVFANPISLWAAVQLLMEIYNFPLNRRIKLLEEKKLKLENEQLEQKKDCNSVVREKIKAKLAEHQATALFESLKKRLEHNPIKLKDIELLG